MCDFSEYTPMDSKFHNFDGPPETYHNRYPYEWAKLNKEALEEAGVADETIYFMRAGSTFSPSVTSLYWMGDQLTTYDAYDGMQSALIGLMNGGMSGFSLGHSDIGGYTAVNYPKVPFNEGHYQRDEELLKRWIEMNTFSDIVYRTHPSNLPDFDAQIWDNEGMA